MSQQPDGHAKENANNNNVTTPLTMDHTTDLGATIGTSNNNNDNTIANDDAQNSKLEWTVCPEALEELMAQPCVKAPPSLSQFASPHLLFLRRIERLSHKGEALPRVLLLSRQSIFLTTESNEMKRVVPIAAISEVVCGVGTGGLPQVLVRVPSDHDLLIVFSEKARLRGRGKTDPPDVYKGHDDAAKHFVSLLQLIRRAYFSTHIPLQDASASENELFKVGKLEKPRGTYVDEAARTATMQSLCQSHTPSKETLSVLSESMRSVKRQQEQKQQQQQQQPVSSTCVNQDPSASMASMMADENETAPTPNAAMMAANGAAGPTSPMSVPEQPTFASPTPMRAPSGPERALTPPETSSVPPPFRRPSPMEAHEEFTPQPSSLRHQASPVPSPQEDMSVAAPGTRLEAATSTSSAQMELVAELERRLALKDEAMRRAADAADRKLHTVVEQCERAIRNQSSAEAARRLNTERVLCRLVTSICQDRLRGTMQQMQESYEELLDAKDIALVDAYHHSSQSTDLFSNHNNNNKQVHHHQFIRNNMSSFVPSYTAPPILPGAIDDALRRHLTPEKYDLLKEL
eukprot:PhM_4_TR572/c0_g1_i1/m.106031